MADLKIGELSAQSAYRTTDRIPAESADGTSNVYWPVSQLSPFQKSFISSTQTITTGTLLTLTHSLGATPALVTAVLVCGSSEAGYVPGDEVQQPLNDTGSNSGSADVAADSTAIYVVFGFVAVGVTFRVKDKTTATITSLTNANWAYKVRAYA